MMKKPRSRVTRRVTLADVAKEVGLSRTAASMILTGRPDTRLSQDAHKRVMEAAQRLGYRPNLAARSLRTDRTQSIAFISDVVATTRFATGLIRGALEAAEASNHIMFVLETNGDPSRESKAISAALDRQVDGIIFASMRARELFLPDTPVTVPAVMLNATNPGIPISILPDELEGGRAAVRLLVQAGLGDAIALLGQSNAAEEGLFRSETVAQRVAGIQSEMHAHGLTFIAEESCWDWEPDEGYKIARKMLRSGKGIRAMLCMNDRLAIGAYQALAEHGVRIPDDISIVSFDNDDIAAYLRPGLTTIALPHEEMGRQSVRHLLSEPQKGVHLVPMPVITRKSVISPARGDQKSTPRPKSSD